MRNVQYVQFNATATLQKSAKICEISHISIHWHEYLFMF